MVGSKLDSKATVCIIGAGLSGMTMAIRLKERGFNDFVIYERDVDVGGTWLTNAYPGCRCDIAAHLYSLSTHPNPDWSSTFPTQTEILAYWQDIARKEGLYPHIKFLTSYKKGIWDEKAQEWVITLAPTSLKSTFGSYADPDGRLQQEQTNVEPYEVRHKIMISNTGGFSWPSIPKIKGLPNPYIHDDQPGNLYDLLDAYHASQKNPEAAAQEVAAEPHVPKEEQFEGAVIHPSRWPRSGLNLKGKTVAVMGNGCSGTQVVAALSQDPEIQVVNYVRSGQWYLPRQINHHSSITKFLFRYIPGLMQLYRFILFWLQDLTFLSFKLSNQWLRNMMEGWSRKHIQRSVPAAAIPTLTPKFPFGGKRTVFDAGYTAAFTRPNFEAVTSPVKHFTKDSIVTEDGVTHKTDVVVIATGFDVTASGVDVTGRGGTHVVETVIDENGPQCYRGLGFPRFPNMWSLMAWNVAPGHNSVMINIEVQANYLAQVITEQIKHHIPVLEIKDAPSRKYNKWLDDRIDETTWKQAASFYRLGRNHDGRVFTNWPAMVWLYCWQNRSPHWDDIMGAETIAAEKRAANRTKFGVLLAALAFVVYKAVSFK